MNNKRGQVFFLILMLVVVLIIIALALAGPMASMIGQFRGAAGLNCAVAGTNYQQATCIISDLFLPIFIGFIILLAGALVGAKAIS